MSISFKTFAITRGEQEVVKAGHWIYDSLTAIMIDSGIAHFYDETPLTVQEIKILLLGSIFIRISVVPEPYKIQCRRRWKAGNYVSRYAAQPRRRSRSVPADRRGRQGKKHP